MNIIIIADVNFPEGMAATAHITLMAKGIIENGINVLLTIPSKSFNGKVKNQKSKTEGVYDSIPYKFFNKHKTKKTTFTFNSLRNVIDLAKFLKRRKKEGVKDVILTYNNDFLKNFPIFLTCYFSKIPLFPWEVEKRTSSKTIGSYRTRIQQLGYRLSDRIIPKISNGLIVISSFLKKYYSQKMHESRIHISPILVDPEDSKKLFSLSETNDIKKVILENQKQDKNIIVYSGSFGEKDGFPYILKTFKMLVVNHPNSILITTGKPGKYNPIENILETVDIMGLKNRFTYLGLVSREELRFVNQNADLLLVCRSNSEFANHGFPWKLGEYLMTKNPIIATKVGDIEYFLKDNEEIFLAQAENEESIYLKMKEVFEDYAKAKQIAENGYKKGSLVFNYIDRTKNDIKFIEKNLERD